LPATKKRNQEVTVGRRKLKLTNLDKVLYPKTKTRQKVSKTKKKGKPEKKKKVTK